MPALRTLIKKAMDTLALSDPDPGARSTAVLKLGNSQKLTNIAVLQERQAKETDAGVKKNINESIAMLQLGDPDPKVQIAAVQQLAALKTIGSLDMVKALAEKKGTDPEVVKATKIAATRIGEHITAVNFFGTIFRGISGGSILLIVALGLSITFGLMGIINMAHGEMIAIGAYTSYVVQNIFGTGFSFSVNLPFSFFGHPLGFGLSIPGMNATGWFYESYFLFVLPLSFIMAALAGLLAGTHRHSFSLPSSAGIPAGDMGCFVGDAAALPHGFRREQCAGQFSPLAARSLRHQRRFARLQSRLRHRLRGGDRHQHLAAADQDTAGAF